MIGCYSIVSINDIKDKTILKEIHADNKTIIEYDKYNGYPIEYWEENNVIYLIEGMIYNYSDEVIKNKLKTILQTKNRKGDYKKNISEFIDKADGDFIIHILDKKNCYYLVFNDFLGRLPLYFQKNDDKLIMGREIKYILERSQEISFNKPGIIDWLRFGYTFGEDTMFNNIKRLEPSSMLEVVYSENTFKFNHERLIDLIVDNNKKHFKNKKEAISELHKIFLEGTKNRIETLEKKGYKLVSDLSGGYDSRTVFGGLQNFTKNITYYTLEYIVDESEVSHELFTTLDEPGKFIKLSFDNSFNENRVEKYVFETDGLVDYYTTVVCYQDQLEYKKQVKGRVARWMGFGGEFIRHPLKRSKMPTSFLFKEVLSSTDINNTCGICKADPSEYEDVKLIKSRYCNENDLKKIYYEYYLQHVVRSGEERSRKDFWTIQPMMTNSFMKAVLRNIPLRWCDYRFHINFLKQIDRRLLNVPIFNSKVDLKNYFSVLKKDFKEVYLKWKSYLYIIIKLIFPKIIEMYKSKKHVDDSEAIRLFDKYYKSLKICNELIDYDLGKENLLNYGGNRYNRLVTLLIYFKTIEDRFSCKIKL